MRLRCTENIDTKPKKCDCSSCVWKHLAAIECAAVPVSGLELHCPKMAWSMGERIDIGDIFNINDVVDGIVRFICVDLHLQTWPPAMDCTLGGRTLARTSSRSCYAVRVFATNMHSNRVNQQRNARSQGKKLTFQFQIECTHRTKIRRIYAATGEETEWERERRGGTGRDGGVWVCVSVCVKAERMAKR